MIHTIEVDSSTRNGRKILEQVRSMRSGVKEKSPIVDGKVPEGYMTIEEFHNWSTNMIEEKCHKYGITVKK